MHISRTYINGQFLNPDQSSLIDECFNPATGEAEARYVSASLQDVDEAVCAARKAFETTPWSQSPKLRSDMLRLFADRLEACAPEISQVLVALNGKLKREADQELNASVSELRYYSGLARNIFGRNIEIEPDKYSLIEKEAVGVAAVVVPWNAPATLLIRSLAPALAAGCSVVIKAAHQTAQVNEMIMKCLVQDQNLPLGVVNWFTERGSQASQYLCMHPDVDVVSFTGSTHVGKLIAESSAKRLARLSLELGGKAPAIVLKDADLDRAVAGIVAGATVMAGQMCTAISRVLVHESIKDTVLDRMVSAFKGLRVGPGADPASQMGALIDKASQSRLLREIDEAKQSAELLLEGQIPADMPEASSFLSPSIIAAQDLDSHFIQEELFGPIVTFETYSDIDEAVARSNATRYGLASSIWTTDYRIARYMARRLKFGNVWINAHNRLFAEVETGGYKESGVGRLHGVDGLLDFIETKHVYIDTTH